MAEYKIGMLDDVIVMLKIGFFENGVCHGELLFEVEMCTAGEIQHRAAESACGAYKEAEGWNHEDRPKSSAVMEHRSATGECGAYYYTT